MACVYARMEQGGMALECLENLARVCVMNNFFTVHNDWRCMGVGMDMPRAPFQIDANMGFTAAINDMLLLSEDNCLHLLPALPPAWTAGEIAGIAAKGGIAADIGWDRRKGLVRLTLRAKKDACIDLLLPGEIVRACMDGCALPCRGRRVPGLTLVASRPQTLDIALCL